MNESLHLASAGLSLEDVARGQMSLMPRPPGASNLGRGELLLLHSRPREKLALFMAASILLTVQETSAAGLLPPITALNDRSNLMLRTHGCHYSCECGSPREFGCEQQYHRHLHMLCLPVRCERRPDCERAPAVGACRHMAPR